MRFEWNCICGAYWKGEMSPKAVAGIRKQWDIVHPESSTEHGPCSAEYSRRRRESAEKAEAHIEKLTDAGGIEGKR